MTRSDDDTKKSKRICTCDNVNTASETNKHGHSVACDCYGLDIPNRCAHPQDDEIPGSIEGLDDETPAASISEAVRQAAQARSTQPASDDALTPEEQQEDADAIDRIIRDVLAKGADTVSEFAAQLYAAASTGNREEIKRIREALKKSDQNLAAGIQFTLKRDVLDPRWDIVIARLPNITYHGKAINKEPAPEVELRGERARWRFIRWAIASVAGVAAMLGAPPEFEMALKLLAKEAMIQAASADADA